LKTRNKKTPKEQHEDQQFRQSKASHKYFKVGTKALNKVQQVK